MIHASFVIVPNPTTPSAMTCPPDNNAMVAVPPNNFASSSRLQFDWKVARRNRFDIRQRMRECLAKKQLSNGYFFHPPGEDAEEEHLFPMGSNVS